LLVLNLRQMGGLEICRRVGGEATTSRVPILVLTAGAEESDKVLGLNLGADDYITEHYGMRELIARGKALARRPQDLQVDGPDADNGRLRIDPAAFSVRYSGREVRLTRKEFALLEQLARNQGRVMTREVSLDRVWGMSYYGDSRTLDVHIRRLRQKLGDQKVIETITGIGYRLPEATKREDCPSAPQSLAETRLALTGALRSRIISLSTPNPRSETGEWWISNEECG